MNGQKLLNNTLLINAGFSLLSGIDFVLFDRTIMGILAGKDMGSLTPIGIMLIGFAGFVFIVSMLKRINKYLVGAIISMDAMWVLGSVFIVVIGAGIFTTIGLILISTTALIIGVFASLQTLGLTNHLKDQTA